MKKAMFIVIIVFLFLPFLQKKFNLFHEEDLKGVFNIHPRPNFVSMGWFNAEFQKHYDNYFNTNCGFKKTMVKLNHQLNYSFFYKTNKETVTLGKDNVLFDERYINTLMGDDYIGEKAIYKKIDKLKTVSDLLRNDNKKLLLVLAPNKARYFEEAIPDSYVPSGRNNYNDALKQLKNTTVDYIDFNQWFLQKKQEKMYDFIPRYGIHWSNYSVNFVMDSIIDFCNKHYGFDLPTYQTKKMIKTDQPRNPDYDLGEVMNLIYPLKGEQYKYLERTPSKEKGSKKVLVISDSFYNNLFGLGFNDDIMDLSGFWLYNNDVVNEKRQKLDEDLKKALPETDLVIIMLTEWNLYRLGFGVLDEINNYYTGEYIESKGVRQYLDRIRADKAWFAGIVEQAKDEGVHVDTMLLRNAQHMDRVRRKK